MVDSSQRRVSNKQVCVYGVCVSPPPSRACARTLPKSRPSRRATRDVAHSALRASSAALHEASSAPKALRSDVSLGEFHSNLGVFYSDGGQFGGKYFWREKSGFGGNWGNKICKCWRQNDRTDGVFNQLFTIHGKKKNKNKQNKTIVNATAEKKLRGFWGIFGGNARRSSGNTGAAPASASQP